MAHALLAVSLLLQVASAREAYERGRRLYESGADMPGARAALDEAIQADPTFADAFLYRAMVAEDVTGLAAARADFEQALALDPRSKAAHRYYAEALVSAGELDAGERHYREALDLDPTYGEAWYMLGRLERQRGHLEEAISDLEHDAALEPKGSAHHELAEIFLARGDDTRAEKELGADLEADPSCYDSRLNLAGLLLEKGRAAEARDAYETSLGYHPADVRALSGLGRAYLALGDYELAVGSLRRAAAIDPHDTRVAASLARARLRLRLAYAWPFAAAALALALALTGVIIHMRHLGRRGRP